MPVSPQQQISVLKQADHLMDQMDFDLRQVTWGYQEIFREVIGELCATGLLGADNEHVTREFFEILQRSDKSGFDMVLKSYLGALRSEYRWVMRLPRLFERWSRTGLLLAEDRYFLGARFFEYSGEGRLGDTPGELEFVLDLLAQLRQEQPELLAPLMEGYEYLRENLDPSGIREFLGHALTLHRRNPDSARRFLAGELETSQVYVQRLSRQANLQDEKVSLERLARALSGDDVSVDHLGKLDSDDLQERGTHFVCCECSMYLPAKFTEFADRKHNRAAYRAMVTTACASHQAGGFSTVHGKGGLETCCDLFGENGQRDRLCALFYITEIYRIIQFCRENYPGVKPILHRLVDLEFERHPVRTAADALLAFLLDAREDMPDEAEDVVEFLREVASASDDFQSTRQMLGRRADDLDEGSLRRFGSFMPRSLSFFPDPMFPLTISEACPDQLKPDLHDAQEVPPDEESDSDSDRDETDAGEQREDQSGEGSEEADESEEGAAGNAGYWYDEWNESVADYQRNWCRVQEVRPPKGRGERTVPDSVRGYASRVREVFERLKPEEVRTEKRLMEGDSIHIDHLIEYLSQGENKQSAEMRFYNKPLIDRRDLAISILLDVSGSTGEEADSEISSEGGGEQLEFAGGREPQTVLQVEKEAAFVLATGLDGLGDSFALYGFTGNGRENCLFYRFKEFEEDWDEDTAQELLAAVPGSATRIGAALRHAGWKLSQRGEKTRLLLLITDGKPCDQGYETESQYAQHDIRKACQENRREDIHTFCVSTSENTPADMELMFPRGRYIILDDIRKLPSVLSRLYLRLTR